MSSSGPRGLATMKLPSSGFARRNHLGEIASKIGDALCFFVEGLLPTFYADHNQLKTLVTKLVAKLCEG